jgi:hypothetical protein
MAPGLIKAFAQPLDRSKAYIFANRTLLPVRLFAYKKELI